MDLKTRIYYAVCDAAGNLGGDVRQYNIRGASMHLMNRYLGCKNSALVMPQTYTTIVQCKKTLAKFRKTLAEKPHLLSDICTANELLFTLEKHYLQNGRRPLSPFTTSLRLR